ncbi:4-coumarate--CoA ligase-like 1 [Hibiscus syriacus]|uniref:4-coumarate--CoA ligase-like 1 n=1 Tax=Hibiscus syriacus TaxID=106335 RepID=UPI001921DD9D|nr:4-coumarate--CoA ligase-like 1 [Hibiscus syriacus]
MWFWCYYQMLQKYGIVALGIMACGVVFSGVNPVLHPSEIMKQANAANAKLIVTNGPNYEKVKDLEQPVVVLGEERIEGATNWYELNLVANLCSSLFSIRTEMIGEVTTLGLIPFSHVYGIVGICCATLGNKGKVVVMNRFNLRTFLNTLITQEVTFAPIVPPIILALVKNSIVDEFDLSKLKLRAVMTAAAPLAPELLASFENKFPGVQVQEVRPMAPFSHLSS